MRSILWLFGIGMTGLLHAQSAQVAYPTDYYSFEEIARALSVEGRTVTCDPALRQRMALLSLKPRPWNEVRRLLEQGLDLEIVRISKEQDAWHLRRRKEVVQQERKLLDQLAQVLEKKLNGKTPQRYPNWSEILRSLPSDIKEEDLHALQEWRSQMEEFLKGSSDEREELGDAGEESGELRRLLGHRLEKFGRMPSSPRLVHWARSQAKLPKEEFLRRFGTYFGEYMISLDEEARTRYILLALSEGLLHREDILLVNHLCTLLQRREVARQTLEQGLVILHSSLPPEVAMRLSASSDGPQRMSQAVGMLVYRSEPEPDQIQLVRTPYVLDMVKGTLKRFLDDNGAVLIGVDSDSLIALFKEMDMELHTHYLQATQEHRRLTQDPAYQTPIRLAEALAEKSGREAPIRVSLYTWFARFAEQLGQEVIVELYPQRAPTWVSKEALSLSQVASLLEEDGNGAWRVERVGDVWVWRNWLAFLDHVPNYPLAAIRQLVRSGRQFSDYLQFYRQVSLAQVRSMLLSGFGDCAHLFSAVERIGTLCGLGETWLVVALLGRISDWEREVPSSGELEIPLNRLRMPPNLLQEWASLLTETGVLEANDEVLQTLIWLGRSGELADRLSREGVLRIKVRDRQSFFCSVEVGDKPLVDGLFYFRLRSSEGDDRR